MKILYICSSIPSRGIHHYASLLPRAVKRLGADIHILSSPGEADAGVRRRLAESGIAVTDFPRPEERGNRSRLDSARFLARVLPQTNFDVIHVYGFETAVRCWLAQRVFMRPRRRIPIVVTLAALRHGQIEEWPARFVAAKVLNRLPVTVCPISSLESRKMRLAGLAPAKMRMVPFFIDPAELTAPDGSGAAPVLPFGPNSGRTVIVYLANFIPRKGHGVLLEAARRVVARHPAAMFVLAGEGPDLDKTRALAQKMGLADHTYFPGRVAFGQVPLLLRDAHMGVVSSYSETFGSAIIEPLLAGRPVATTDVGFAGDLASADGVLKVRRGDGGGLARAVLRLIDDPELARRAAEKGRAFVLDHCEINKVAGRYVEIYERATA